MHASFALDSCSYRIELTRPCLTTATGRRRLAEAKRSADIAYKVNPNEIIQISPTSGNPEVEFPLRSTDFGARPLKGKS